MTAVLFAVFVALCALALAWIDSRRIALRDGEIDRLDAAREADADEAAATYEAALDMCSYLGEQVDEWRIKYQRAADDVVRVEVGELSAGRLGAVTEVDQLRKRCEGLARMLGTERDAATLRVRIRALRVELDALRCNDLDAFHDGELSDERAAAFRLHLATCPRCDAGLLDLAQIEVGIRAAKPDPRGG